MVCISFIVITINPYKKDHKYSLLTFSMKIQQVLKEELIGVKILGMLATTKEKEHMKKNKQTYQAFN